MDTLLERTYFTDIFDSEINLFKEKFGPDFDGWQVSSAWKLLQNTC
ncbi:unnamed protein product [Cylicostephanus goldi]|uniref:Uncharacterized protein n=1 Tax=Cylicostephanus goldi TaxID=71465 RepID=A0A3P7MQ04_CYLGO|nr:unnamed protein product [Cylicostephanus goldi]